MNPVSEMAGRVLNWLRQGYPNGLRATDTYAVLYVLERELNKEDLEEVVNALIEGTTNDPNTRTITREEIAHHIEEIHRQEALKHDIEHVRQALSDAGFEVTNHD